MCLESKLHIFKPAQKNRQVVFLPNLPLKPKWFFPTRPALRPRQLGSFVLAFHQHGVSKLGQEVGRAGGRGRFGSVWPVVWRFGRGKQGEKAASG